MELEIIFEEDGSLQFIHNDDLAELFEGEALETRRASHVEPCTGGWEADLSPVGGPKLGPFKRREDALQSEVAWLRARMAAQKVEART